MTGPSALQMRRDPARLAGYTFDLLVIGAGIHGVCVARDAAMRGLSVALIDQGDLGGATSHNSLKLIHGGIRYLQHLDVRRVRESIRERSFWLSCAPHLTRPLRFVMPAYGHGLRGVAALGAAVGVYGLLGLGCGNGRPQRCLPGSRVLSRREMLRLLPALHADRLTGGVCWTDGQMVDAARIVLECAQAAVESGAVVCNYVRARTFIRDGARVIGVDAEDVLDGHRFELRARQCVNTAGPWINSLLSAQFPEAASTRLAGLSKCINLVTRRVPAGHAADFAFGVASKRSSDAVLGNSRRMFFVTPWRGLSVIGTSHLPYAGHPDELQCSESDIEAFLTEINAAYPFGLTAADVLHCHVGLTPAHSGLHRGQVIRARRGEIIDHHRANGIEGLTSVIGVKYTTARLLAERTVDLVRLKLDRKTGPCRTAVTRLPGAVGAADVAAKHDGTALCLRARRAARTEMAVRLSDFLFRRSTLAETGAVTRCVATLCAGAMGDELGWSYEHRRTEIEAALAALPWPRAAPDNSAAKAPPTLAPGGGKLPALAMPEGAA